MKQKLSKITSYVMIAALVVSVILPTSPAAAKSKAPKLSKKKISVKVGKKKKIKVKNTTKKVKWSIKKGKKNISLTSKKKTSVKVLGKKAGKATVQAKVGKKKLTCKVTVKKSTTVETTEVAAVTSTPAPTDSVSVAPTQTPDASDTGTDTDTTEAEAVEDVVIDMSKISTTTFTSSPATINFSSQIEDRFDLSYFEKMVVTYELNFEGDDSSLLSLGKIGLAQSSADLTGYADGVAYTYNMVGGSTSVSISLSNLSGTAYGINIQPMDSSYGWPSTLTSVTITGITFVAKEGAVYSTSEEATATATPIVAEYESSEFVYEGLDQDWIDANIDPTKPVVAMSFDDGPGTYSGYVEYGTQIQEALTQYGAHATFFYIGSHIEHDAESRAEVEAAYKAGFEVANHSYDSNGLNAATADTIKEKIKKTNDLLTEITGYSSFLFRAPNVAYSDTMYAVIEAPFIDVSIWSNDYQSSVDKDAIVENVTSKLADGGIINMHSVYEKTAEAVPEILEYCKENDYQVVSVSELFAIKGVKLMTGVKYYSCS